MGTRPLYCIFTGPSFAVHEFESPVWTELGALHVTEGGRTLGSGHGRMSYKDTELMAAFIQN